jgi:hypothetical protein
MVLEYGKVVDAILVYCKICKNNLYVSPVGKQTLEGAITSFEYFLPYAGWKKSRRGWWSCPNCVAKREKKEKD